MISCLSFCCEFCLHLRSGLHFPKLRSTSQTMLWNFKLLFKKNSLVIHVKSLKQGAGTKTRKKNLDRATSTLLQAVYSSRKFKFHNLCVFQTCVLKLCVLALLLQNYNTGMITLSLSGWRRENAIESFLLRFHVKVRKFSSKFYRSVDFQYQKRANAKRSSFERYLSLSPFGKLSMLCV